MLSAAVTTSASRPSAAIAVAISWRFSAALLPLNSIGCGRTEPSGRAGRASPQAASSGFGATGRSMPPAFSAAWR